jgi:hypothetical protein
LAVESLTVDDAEPDLVVTPRPAASAGSP